MPLKLSFSHLENGNASAKMVFNDAKESEFDYVALVKYLFKRPNDDLLVDVDDTYTQDQKERLEELVNKIRSAARMHDASSTSDSEMPDSQNGAESQNTIF